MKYITEERAKKLFNDYIDRMHETIVILDMNYCPSSVLEEVDPTAYQCCFADWLASKRLITE